MNIRITIRRDLDLMTDTMDQIIDEVISRNRIFLIRSDRGWVPAVDIYETESEIILLAELPGVKKEEIQVTLGNKHVKFCGIRHDIAPKQRIHQMEIDFGKFERTIKVPAAVTDEGSSATYSDGFLVIRLQKK
ncbi:MAG: hypothetical protein A2161_18125 [Candidatus Schekmanbacteria bacterium RBG_13_48_7]|uniref:Uncharacterized protein n=1 Tax=Candidatus Schekmanbacteria bacterium RBG_13_48_7 TaxID=1817878 RepID=A0A1F7RSN7_9BACT|nr:MAG: hypothetical protein A2161_18125 [Candidatus Schekmanbacteria bacterium RBG_13_48_7]